MAQTASPQGVANESRLQWQVHLARRHPERLPALAMILVIGAICVWLLFGQVLPVLVALCLLLGAAVEYLLPIQYTIDREGVAARSAVSHLALSWRDVRRCRSDMAGMLVTPLPVASRLDRFRGVFLRYAQTGEMGDHASVYMAIAHFAPDIVFSSSGTNVARSEVARSEVARSETVQTNSPGPNEIGGCP
jgi:hypothetical protein